MTDNANPVPLRKKSRMQPIVAMKALKTLIDDPEQTEQVFIVIKAMSGNALEKSFDRFKQTETGKQILLEQRRLLTTLQNQEELRQLEADSLGRHYLNFVETEGITADGLVEASQNDDPMQDPALRLFGERLRDSHDLWHVTTGYGTDTFGEACLLAFTYAQTRNRGLGIIAIVGMFKITQELGPEVKKAMWQAYRAGKKAAWLPEQDWESLLQHPIEEVRQRLNIKPPVKYQEVFEQYSLVS
ncbi:MAG: Coq4 family protein [Gammaproteobacteria bacterium]|nr:Coq4 family protein [Gammaproteobacteria bacterium]